MSNSPLVSYTRLSPHVRGVKVYPITRITVHHVVGLLTVEQLGECFQTSRLASSNYGIGVDGRVALYVDESKAAMTSNDWDNDNRAVTIECADEATWPYTIPDIVYSRLIDLCVDVCRRNGKKKLLWLEDRDVTLAYAPKDDEMVLTVHRWFAATLCPGQWAMQHMADLAAKVTEILNPKEEPEVPNEPKLDNTPAAWAKDAVDWAVATGLMAGGSNGDLMLHSPLTREQMCVMLKRFHELTNAKALGVDPAPCATAGVSRDSA